MAKTSNKRPTQMDKVGFWDIIYMVIKNKNQFSENFCSPHFQIAISVLVLKYGTANLKQTSGANTV